MPPPPTFFTVSVRVFSQLRPLTRLWLTLCLPSSCCCRYSPFRREILSARLSAAFWPFSPPHSPFQSFSPPSVPSPVFFHSSSSATLIATESLSHRHLASLEGGTASHSCRRSPFPVLPGLQLPPNGARRLARKCHFDSNHPSTSIHPSRLGSQERICSYRCRCYSISTSTRVCFGSLKVFKFEPHQGPRCHIRVLYPNRPTFVASIQTFALLFCTYPSYHAERLLWRCGRA